MNKHPLTGAQYLFKGFQLIMQPQLRVFVTLPLLINTILFVSLMSWAGTEFSHLITWVDSILPSWLQWLNWLMWILFSLGFLIIFAYSFTFITILIASPFNALLAEKVELYLRGELQANTSMVDSLKDIPRCLWREWQKLAYYIPRAIGLLCLFIIPFVQIIAPLTWFLFNAWTMAMIYYDYPMDNHRVDFLSMRLQMQQRRLTYFSFGSMVLVLTLIPIVNFFVIPAAIAGATAMWVDENQ